MAPYIDYNTFPKLVERILGIDPDNPGPLYELIPLRLLCRAMQYRVDDIHLKHIVVRDLPCTNANGQPGSFPVVTSGWTFTAPALMPLQLPRRVRTTSLPHFETAMETMDEHLMVMDLVGVSNSIVLTERVVLRTLRLRADGFGRHPQVPTNWLCNNLVICMGHNSFTWYPSYRLQEGLRGLVLHPCFPHRFQIDAQRQDFMLNVIFPPHADLAMALYEAAYLIHDDVDRFMLGLLRGLGAAVPFTELLATILQATYVNEHTQRQNNNSDSHPTPESRVKHALDRITILTREEYAEAFDFPEDAPFVMEID